MGAARVGHLILGVALAVLTGPVCQAQPPSFTPPSLVPWPDSPRAGLLLRAGWSQTRFLRQEERQTQLYVSTGGHCLAQGRRWCGGLRLSSGAEQRRLSFDAPELALGESRLSWSGLSLEASVVPWSEADGPVGLMVFGAVDDLWGRQSGTEAAPRYSVVRAGLSAAWEVSPLRTWLGLSFDGWQRPEGAGLLADASVRAVVWGRRCVEALKPLCVDGSLAVNPARMDEGARWTLGAAGFGPQSGLWAVGVWASGGGQGPSRPVVWTVALEGAWR